MTKIAKITVQKRAKQRYNVFVYDRGEERYAFSVDEDVLIKYGLKKGQELDEEELKRVIEADEEKKTYHLALHYISYRMRSEKEVTSYLEKKERSAEHINKTIALLKGEKLLDDGAFTKAYIRTQTNQSTVGPAKLKQQLLLKGVSAEIIAGELASLDISWQRKKLEQWKDKQSRMQKGKKESAQQLKKKRHNQLLSKGFDYEAIKQVLDEADLEKNIEDEHKALEYQAEKLYRTYSRKYEQMYELKQKLTAALYRKGFAFDDINRFLDEKLEEMK